MMPTPQIFRYLYHLIKVSINPVLPMTIQPCAKSTGISCRSLNILGHIFENSLNEIETVNAELEGVVFEKQTSKRKKDGVFYTPKYITK